MLKRTARASFASGMYVFPGGRVDGDDHLHKYDDFRFGPTDAQHAQVAKVAPLGRSATPDDCAEATIGILRAKYLTGQVLVVDGGTTIAS